MLTSPTAGRKILAALRARFRCHAEAVPESHAVFYDTFDGRLHRDGGVLAALPLDGGGYTASWRSHDGTLRHRTSMSDRPAFTEAFPPGTLREAIAPLIAMRTLLPLVEVRLRGNLLRILDNAEKTVSRVELLHGTAREPGENGRGSAIAPSLLIHPVRGYPQAHDEVVRFLEREQRLQRSDSPLTTLALAAIGKQPGASTSKIVLALDPQMPADAAARSLLSALLQTILHNEEGARLDLDSEFLHDFRVAVRRTRTCLGQLREVFCEHALDRFRKDFAWLGGVTGPTRDLDVFLLKMPGYRDQLPRRVRPALEPLESFLRECQRTEQLKLARQLQSRRYRKLVVDWSALLASPPEGRPPIADATILSVASARIAKRLARVLRRGRSIGPTSPIELLHRLRIDCKKLRYLLEFFRALYDPAELEPYVRSLKRLQDNLGDLHDYEVQQDSLAGFAGEMAEQREASVESLLAVGRLVERLETSKLGERRRFAKRFGEFCARQNLQRLQRMLQADTRETP